MSTAVVTLEVLRQLTTLVEAGLTAPYSVTFYGRPCIHLNDDPAVLDPWVAHLGLSAPAWEPHYPGSENLLAVWAADESRPFDIHALRPIEAQAAIDAAGERAADEEFVIPDDAIAVSQCSCGFKAYVGGGGTAEDLEAHVQACADHDAMCSDLVDA